MDMWSVGCILAELVLRRPLFPGKSTMQQLQYITEILGSPTEDDLADCVNAKARHFMESLPPKEKADWKKVFRGKETDDIEIDFINKLLQWKPENRMTVDEALEHPFMAKLHDPFDEPISFPLDSFEFETPDITIDELKFVLWNEIVKRHPEYNH